MFPTRKARLAIKEGNDEAITFYAVVPPPFLCEEQRDHSSHSSKYSLPSSHSKVLDRAPSVSELGTQLPDS